MLDPSSNLAASRVGEVVQILTERGHVPLEVACRHPSDDFERFDRRAIGKLASGVDEQFAVPLEVLQQQRTGRLHNGFEVFRLGGSDTLDPHLLPQIQ